MDLQTLLMHCKAIATQAGDAVMAVYATDFTVEKKADSSPLTQADIAAHQIITDRLAKLEPKLPCLSEEGANIPFTQRAQWQRYWLVDPLDGTREFVKRNGEFTVNIALIDDGIPILGVIYAPVLETTYYATRDGGTWRERAGERVRLHTRTTPDEPCLLVSKSYRSAELDALLANMPPHIERSRGSSLKFCLIAEGVADLYPRTGATCEWDTAAGQCIVEQAGGELRALPGWQRLRYNTKESLINPSFAVVGDPHYEWKKFVQQSSDEDPRQ